MSITDVKRFRTAWERSSSARPRIRPKKSAHSAKLRAYAKLDWVPWTQDNSSEAPFPSDESMCVAAEVSRTAYSIMHLTKDQLVKIHSAQAFDGFEETVANLETTAEMLRAVAQMIEGARGRMLASACACLQDKRPRDFLVGIEEPPKIDTLC
jgi:hypothetical protein